MTITKQQIDSAFQSVKTAPPSGKPVVQALAQSELYTMALALALVLSVTDSLEVSTGIVLQLGFEAGYQAGQIAALDSMTEAN
jgi:hypothetical protein